MMKQVILLFILALGSPGTALAGQQTITLAVEKMTCALCPFTVSKALKNVEGVTSVDVDYASKTAKVTFDDAITDVNTVAEASTNAGYPATPQ
jgi:mercuric ion binding protein